MALRHAVHAGAVGDGAAHHRLVAGTVKDAQGGVVPARPSRSSANRGEPSRFR